MFGFCPKDTGPPHIQNSAKTVVLRCPAELEIVGKFRQKVRSVMKQPKMLQMNPKRSKTKPS